MTLYRSEGGYHLEIDMPDTEACVGLFSSQLSPTSQEKLGSRIMLEIPPPGVVLESLQETFQRKVEGWTFIFLCNLARLQSQLACCPTLDF